MPAPVAEARVRLAHCSCSSPSGLGWFGDDADGGLLLDRLLGGVLGTFRGALGVLGGRLGQRGRLLGALDPGSGAVSSPKITRLIPPATYSPPRWPSRSARSASRPRQQVVHPLGLVQRRRRSGAASPRAAGARPPSARSPRRGCGARSSGSSTRATTARIGLVTSSRQHAPRVVARRVPAAPYFTLYSRWRADLPPPARVSAPLPAPADPLAAARLAGDGDDGADPAAGRRRRSTRSRSGDRDDILPLALALLGAGVLRLALTVGRRLIAGKVSLAVEYDLRQRFYEHLQKLELAFFDAQQTGQLMSRATVDLQSIRFFLGYGLIWVSQSALTIVFAAAVMFFLDPILAAARARARPVPGRDRDPLQPAQPSRRAGGPAAGRRADRGRRGERLRDPDREGVRARAAHDGSLPPLGRPRLRPEHGLDPAAGLLHAADGLPARTSGWRSCCWSAATR